jgi:hypothetical protein
MYFFTEAAQPTNRPQAAKTAYFILSPCYGVAQGIKFTLAWSVGSSPASDERTKRGDFVVGHGSFQSRVVVVLGVPRRGLMDAKFWTEILKGYQAHPELIIATIVIAFAVFLFTWRQLRH